MKRNNKNMKLILILMIIASLITSCQVKVEEVVSGIWSMDSIYYNGFNIRPCLDGNILTFDKIMEFPVTENNCEDIISTHVNEGKWEIIASDSMPYMINIHTSNKMFSGIHRVIFQNDIDKKMLKMIIQSDKLYIICRKGLYGYDRNIKTINALVKQSTKAK